MKRNFALALAVVVLAAAGWNVGLFRPLTSAVAGTAIDPAIPALTITARRLSAAQKLAYDATQGPRLAEVKAAR